MANRVLFNTMRGRRTRPADAVNEAGGRAYFMSAEQTLAQYVATGCMNNTFYATADEQLDAVLALCGEVQPEFIARAAIYARTEGAMKDMPALLCAVLSVLSPGLMAEIFDRVIDSPKMLRNFVQIMRSGVVARRSLGTLPKRLIRQWLDDRTDEAIFFASIGASPSMADIIKMVHPKPSTASRNALYGYLLGRRHDADALPQIVRDFEAYKNGTTKEVPNVPFQMLTSMPLDRAAWAAIAMNASWQMTRMNLNTFNRNGVFKDGSVVRTVAKRLANRERIEKARAFPYQLLTAYMMASHDIPRTIRRALEAALEVSVRNVPEVAGATYVMLDVSASMHSPVTGHRKGSTTKVRCVDVAALMAASVLRRNRNAYVIPFTGSVQEIRINPRDTVMTNAEKLASMPAGSTNCSAPLKLLNERRAHADTVIYVSDNESWIDTTHGSWRRGTETLHEWDILKRRCPDAKLVCIDVQPYATTQAPDRADILNVGGFSDSVFQAISRFVEGDAKGRHWVNAIKRIVI